MHTQACVCMCVSVCVRVRVCVYVSPNLIPMPSHGKITDVPQAENHWETGVYGNNNAEKNKYTP